jgi:nucleoside-diphosphate-sugar epimerase
MIVLLTGGTGFLGKQILKELMKRHISVRLVRRNNELIKTPFIDGLESEVLSEDIFSENAEWWENACKGVDIVIHAAWYAVPGQYQDSLINFNCLVGTLNLTKGAIKSQVKKIVGIGTCFEYDLTGGYVTESTQLNPTNIYSTVKVATYLALKDMLLEAKINFSWCRMFYMYGEGEDDRRLVPYIKKMLTNGKKAKISQGSLIRDYMKVSEAAYEVVDNALGSSVGVKNICSGIPISIKELAIKIAKEHDAEDMLEFKEGDAELGVPKIIVGNIKNRQNE